MASSTWFDVLFCLIFLAPSWFSFSLWHEWTLNMNESKCVRKNILSLAESRFVVIFFHHSSLILLKRGNSVPWFNFWQRSAKVSKELTNFLQLASNMSTPYKLMPNPWSRLSYTHPDIKPWRPFDQQVDPPFWYNATQKNIFYDSVLNPLF